MVSPSGPTTDVYLHAPATGSSTASEPTAENLQSEVRRLAPLDCLLLAAVVFLSAVPYVPGLGLYGEDWAIMSALERAGAGAREALTAAGIGTYPLEGYYLTFLHSVFRLNFVGYHAVNTAVLAGGVILFYLALRRVGLPRPVALVVPAIFGTIPHYSTDRFWIAAFQCNLAVLLYFASLYADVRFAARPSGIGWLWKAAGAAALVGSLLASEVTAGLLALNVVALIGLAGIQRDDVAEPVPTSIVPIAPPDPTPKESVRSRLAGALKGLKVPGRILVPQPSPWREWIRTPWTLEAQTLELAMQTAAPGETGTPLGSAGEWWMSGQAVASSAAAGGAWARLSAGERGLPKLGLNGYTPSGLAQIRLGPLELSLTSTFPAGIRWSLPGTPLVAGLAVNLLLLGAVLLSGPGGAAGAEPPASRPGLLRLMSDAINVNFIDNGLALPVKVVESLLFHANPTAIAVSLMIGCGVCVYVFAGRHEEGTFGDGESWALFVLFGGILFAAGCAALAVTGDVDFHPTGPVNHTAIAASIGVAWIFAGLTGWIVSRVPPEPSRWMVFSVAIGALAGGGALITGTIGRYWVSAAAEQYQVIERTQQRFPTIPAGTTVLLDGICPYVGPAPVFTSQSDVSSMLHLAYGDPTLRGGVMSHSARLTDEGIHPGGRQDAEMLSYGENLIVFHVPTGETATLSSAEAAREYFLSLSLPARPNCPSYSDRTGAAVF